MKNSIKCPKCEKIIRYEDSFSTMIFCDDCFSCIKIENEKGYGQILPCIIYLGDKKIGKIEEINDECYLNYDLINRIKLNNKGYDAILEAKKLLEEYFKGM